MNYSLLTSLRKYHPRESSDPVENFVTAAFAWLLRRHPDFAAYYLTKITLQMQAQPVANGTRLEWHTLMPLGGVFPDLVCEVGDRAFVFEHKVRSPLGDKQVKNYHREAEFKYGAGKYHLILVTGETWQHSQNPHYALCWRDVHAWIQEWKAQPNYEPPFIFDDFCHLLEHEGMGPPAPVSHEAILGYIPARNFITDVENLVERASKHHWDELLPAGVCKLNVQRNLWGRIGLDLLGTDVEWAPGIFVGFLHDPEDHDMALLNPSIPDFTVIISFNTDQHPRYADLPLYQAMVEHLQRAVANAAPEFKLLNHLAGPLPHNRWHPIHIRMPMLELLRGTRTADDQRQRFIDAASTILQLIRDCPPFWQLRDELQAKAIPPSANPLLSNSQLS